jgi:hypothetical protein
MEEQKDVFTYGDGTLMQLRDDQEFGTCVMSVASEPVLHATPSADVPMSVEQKLDTLIAAVAALQRRLDSIDSTIARALVR